MPNRRAARRHDAAVVGRIVSTGRRITIGAQDARRVAVRFAFDQPRQLVVRLADPARIAASLARHAGALHDVLEQPRDGWPEGRNEPVAKLERRRRAW